MLILDDENKTLEFFLGGASAAPLTFMSSTALLGTDDTYNPINEYGVSNGVTAVTLVSGPSPTQTAQVKEIIIRNPNTAAAIVTIQENDALAVILTIILVITLQLGDQLIYNDEGGWYVLNSSGQVKQVSGKVGTKKSFSLTLTNAIADLFTAVLETGIDSIVAVDIDATDRTFDLYIKTLASGTDVEFTQVTNPIAAKDAVYVTLPLNLQPGDKLRGNASANTAVTLIVSYTEYA